VPVALSNKNDIKVFLINVYFYYSFSSGRGLALNWKNLLVKTTVPSVITDTSDVNLIEAYLHRYPRYRGTLL